MIRKILFVIGLATISFWSGMTYEYTQNMDAVWELEQKRIDFEKYKHKEQALLNWHSSQNRIWENTIKQARK